MTADLKELTQRLVAFRDARDWRQFHGIKNLIVSVGVEAGELLELVQWLDDAGAEAALADAGFRQRLAEECADVLLYLLLACERAGVDLGQAALTKIAANAEKYPVEKARGHARKYTDS
jgi:NTP pyrophosphatase (non-canonical NTP hydrolase)